ncbi:DUF2207 domain-containing protein [Lederbergia citrea]|uniref:DUF2207 domain-containing protein n=1 Tax=Lederbergia citrea TaxID=2833581 RepID=UPI001BC9F8D8|nr:DUF2207 domain-containing protein [Lederbergia citrea]MBS4179766.1 DUF2207 domain-containing protein [Lederbergia citrea]MBS4206457.1 DUF2207 domain-containing protein [Lederbergia citrea]
MKRKLVTLLILSIFVLLPMKVLAVEYSITDVLIDAQMMNNGDVIVEEKHTYSFDGDFNGITREIVPKKGAKITSFQASEDGAKLKIKKEDHLYKIYRSGSDETIEVILRYRIEGGVTKYKDMTEFYWPFFDERNESSYEQMTITVHPPHPANDVMALGYDEAYEAEQIDADGTVHFHLGKVAAGENGDIRVAYESNLFPAIATTSSKEIKNTIIEEKQKLAEQKRKYAENKETMSSVGKIVIPIVSAIFTMFIAIAAISSRRNGEAANIEITKERLVLPKLKMSMPATIFHTKSFSTNMVAAALLDLVRKKYVKQLSDNEFLLVNRNVENRHETVLLDWLFYEVGKEGTFHSEDLNLYVNEKKNHWRYEKTMAEWRQALKEEIAAFGIFENKAPVRWLFGIVSFMLIPLTVLFILYDLYLWMFMTTLLFMTGMGMTLFYKPLSWDGLIIKKEWQQFWLRFDDIKETEFNKWSEEDQEIALIYGLGTKKKIVSIDDNFSRQTDHSFLTYYMVTGPMLTSTFISADKEIKRAAAADSSTGSGSSSGGGVGGGGGGSGAF